MAFGFGFNKQKVLNSAEKFVQQGKLQNAITEYEKILKADPKDLTVLNTVGDLYSRLGQSDLAVECFKNVGDAYATQGFTVKAIAMYKKLSKLKPSLDCVLRLAELYTQQGLFNDARSQYKQVAEEFLRTGELEQATRIFQKILEMDPENVAMRTKLAEVYVRLGKKAEAWQIFSAAVDSLRARAAIEPAMEIVQRMLVLDPNNSHALLLRGQMAVESGDAAGCIEYLEKVADLDSHPDGLRSLFLAYIQAGRLADAGPLAAKLLSVHNDADAVLGYAEALITAGRFDDALRVYQRYADRLLSVDSTKVLDNLHSLIAHVRGNTASLEILLALLNRAGENTHVTEVYELLAHAAVQSGDLAKARDYYLKLTQLEPQNALHAGNYHQVVNRLGESASPSLITVEEGSTLVDELEATAPFVDQRYADDVALGIRAALTDAELFVSYNMPSKALGPLLSALPKAPRDLRLNQRLAALHTRAGRFAEAAACCRALESIYHDAGFPDEATRYGELAAKYEERAAPRQPIAELPVQPLTETRQPGAIQMEQEGVSALPDFESASMAEPSAPGVSASAFAPIPLHITSPAPAAPSAPRASGLFWHAPAPAAEVTATAPIAAHVPASEPAVKTEVGEREIDLSSEWEDALSGGSASDSIPQEASLETFSAVAANTAAADAAIAGSATIDDSSDSIKDVIAEVRFYLKHLMTDQARAALDRLRRLKPDAASLALVEKEFNAAVADAAAAAEPAAEVSIEESDVPPTAEPEPVSARMHIETPLPAPTAVPQWPAPHVAASTSPVQPAQSGPLGDFVADLENSLGDSFIPQPAAAHAAPAAQQHASSVQVSAPLSAPADRAITSPAGSVHASSAHPSSSHASSAAAAAPALSPSLFTHQTRPLPPATEGTVANPGVDLSDMFGELRQELEDEVVSGPGEDCETHYNLGVAFREMGLLDEAIGELQKVCQAVDHGHPFTQIMQTYTWLAQCFLDKGVPEAAIRWYEKALQIPNLDGETRTALHYEVANAYEAAQNKPWALKHFLEVYGSNIDYRDVSERIKALKS
jgi:tetratricopeptide (TPR) repeat protein